MKQKRGGFFITWHVILKINSPRDKCSAEIYHTAVFSPVFAFIFNESEIHAWQTQLPLKIG